MSWWVNHKPEGFTACASKRFTDCSVPSHRTKKHPVWMTNEQAMENRALRSLDALRDAENAVESADTEDV